MKQHYLSSVILGLMMLGWFVGPTIVAAGWSPSSQWHWTDRHTVDGGVFERDSLIHRVLTPTFQEHFGLTLGKEKDRSESEHNRGSDSAISGKGMQSYDTPLDSRFDIPASVDGHSDRPDPWWGSRTQGEPMLKDLKGLNRDPMRSP